MTLAFDRKHAASKMQLQSAAGKGHLRACDAAYVGTVHQRAHSQTQTLLHVTLQSHNCITYLSLMYIIKAPYFKKEHKGTDKFAISLDFARPADTSSQ